MIEKLLAAFAEGAEDGGPRSGAGVEEIADILWLAARVDPAADRPAAARPPAAQEPPPDPGPAPPVPPPPFRPAPEPAVQLFPAAAPGRPGPSAPAPAPGAGAEPAPALRRGTPLRLPRAASLDDPLALMRSLRPIGRRSIGGPGEELDEQLTVERSIERMVLSPVLRPAETRWLDVALVVDAHHSMLLWSDLVEEVRGALTRSGVFRDVRTWQLTGTGPGGDPVITHGRGTPPRNPMELADPAGRRLILVVSDTVAGGWREAPLRAVLRQWSAHNAVAVLNVLPERLWTRGAVHPVPFAVRADRPAAATRSWQRVPMARRARGGGAVVPVVGIASGSLARLVRVVSGDGRWRKLACLRLDAEPAPWSTYDSPGPDKPPVDALEAVERFRANASPTAQRLAAHLAAVPLTLPVMTLVRRSLLRDSEHSHLAEVALGGLLAPWGPEQVADETEFEFLPGVREALLGSQLRGDVAAVRELVRHRVWEYLSRHRGTGRDFNAIRFTDGAQGRREVAEGALPFATNARPDPGLPDRVVRVRFEPMSEPQAVGVLLSPRLVLTVRDGAGGSSSSSSGTGSGTGTIAWVRSGDRELSCRSVWWDETTPRVFLLLADEDLPCEDLPYEDLVDGDLADGDLADEDVADQGPPPPLLWADGSAAPRTQLVVDGATDQGEPIALTGEVMPYEGERNGELVRLSAEPEAWTHYVGAPVSRDGRLAGIVHSVMPDRMVFLSAQALRDQPGFREAVAAHGQARPEPSGICVAVRAEVALGPRGRSIGGEVTSLLMQAKMDSGVGGAITGTDDGTVLVTIAAPGALGKAGRLLAELPAGLARLRAGSGEWEVSLAAAFALGPLVADAAGVRGPAADAARLLVGHDVVTERLHRQGPGVIVPVLGESVLADALPGSLRTTRIAPGTEWGPWGVMCYDDPVTVARSLIHADLSSGEPAVDWECCDQGGTSTDRTGCTGIRLPGRRQCLAHVPRPDQEAYLRDLRPGWDVDLRGTTFADGLLDRLLSALRDPATGSVRFGVGAFDRARFVDGWSTGAAGFEGRASFDRAVFDAPARFERSRFARAASFGRTVFRQDCVFDGSTFDREARFARADFAGDAGFSDTVFAQGVDMTWADLRRRMSVRRMRVGGGADFSRTAFRGPTEWADASVLGPALFAATVWERPVLFDGARFEDRVLFDAATFAERLVWHGVRVAGRSSFARSRFNAEVRFGQTRFSNEVTFSHAVFAGPVVFRNTNFGGLVLLAEAAFAASVEFLEVTFDVQPALPDAYDWQDLPSSTGTRSLRRLPAASFE